MLLLVFTALASSASHHLVLKSDRWNVSSRLTHQGPPKLEPSPRHLTEFSAIDFPGACTASGRAVRDRSTQEGGPRGPPPVEPEYCCGSPGNCASGSGSCCALRHFHSQHASG